MKRQPDDTVEFTEDIVKSIYSRFKANDTSDPLEQLMNTRGWEAVAKRVSEIVEDYKKKKARALKKQGSTLSAKKSSCANERIDTPDDRMDIDYPVPNFVIKGNPGVGKTTVARLIGQIVDSQIAVVLFRLGSKLHLDGIVHQAIVAIEH